MNAQARHKTITSDIIDARLNQRGFHAKNLIQQLSDPIADTAMLVTLDQLRSYENNPRTTRNPAYDEIKESIKARGLDQPPPITRRPGEAFYIIRNGGNTRLQILNELWSETRDEKFFRIHCLFRPWQSEASVLVGHLAENEVRGNLAFIEKAVGIKQLKDLYEAEAEEGAKALSLSKLSERLKADGLPVSKALLGWMLDCVENLLPAIPQKLYAGLGKHQIVKLLSLRNGLSKVFKEHGDGSEEAFRDFWLSILSGFDIQPDEFKFSRIEDEMIGQMSERTGRAYNMIKLDLYDIDPDRDDDHGEVDLVTTVTPNPGVPVVEMQDAPTEPATKKRLF